MKRYIIPFISAFIFTSAPVLFYAEAPEPGEGFGDEDEDEEEEPEGGEDEEKGDTPVKPYKNTQDQYIEIDQTSTE